MERLTNTLLPALHIVLVGTVLMEINNKNKQKLCLKGSVVIDFNTK